LVFGLGLFLLCVVVIGRLTREGIRDWDRYALAFTDIDCPTPPAQSRADFLVEVRQLAGLPDRLSVLDEDLAERLAKAFARHPWVETVERVAIRPPKQIQVQLVHRTPVLEVMLSERVLKGSPPDAAEPTWLVDGRGRVLPRKDYRDPLPLFFAEARPTGGAGQRWGDKGVDAAARTAGLLHADRKQFGFVSFEMKTEGLVLSTATGTHVLWGHAPEAESAGEAPAAEKRERLCEYCTQHGSLDRPAGRYEHDVRPAAKAEHRPQPREEAP
jgi:hypothetical protein